MLSFALTLLAGASAQIQIGSTALAPSAPDLDAEHGRRLTTTYLSELSLSFMGTDILTDASNWEYKYLVTPTDHVKLSFYLWETYHYPTRKANFKVICSFSAAGKTTETETALNPVLDSLTLPAVRDLLCRPPSPGPRRSAPYLARTAGADADALIHTAPPSHLAFFRSGRTRRFQCRASRFTRRTTRRRAQQ